MTERVLITGGRGLLGNAVIDDVRARGWHITALQRSASGRADGAESSAGVESPAVRDHLGDVTDPRTVDEAMDGCTAVIHLAARVGIDGTWRDFESVNVEGTRVVLSAAQRHGIRAFVQVSSPSVAHAGHPLVGATAEPADPTSARGHYSRSKAMAELLVLGQDEVPAVAIRPHLVWGPGDTQLIGRIVSRARAGRLFMIDGGTALIDTTYIDNAAAAIGAALERMHAFDGLGRELCGRSLVVSNGEPRPVRDILISIVRAAGLDLTPRSVPYGPAYAAGGVAEAVLARRGVEPPVTRFLVEQLATAHWFDQRSTRRLLDWRPEVGLDEGMERLARWYARGESAHSGVAT